LRRHISVFIHPSKPQHGAAELTKLIPGLYQILGGTTAAGISALAFPSKCSSTGNGSCSIRQKRSKMRAMVSDKHTRTTDLRLDKVVRLLVEAASPIRIILFGSRARGNASRESDFDLVVIEREVRNRRAETVRLLRLLEPYEIPVDLLVTSEEFFENWKTIPSTVLYTACKEGKIVYEAA
jgi:predicted nucleotidyltransferase